MNEYQDSDSYWHDQKCINGEPRSNNRNTYTAYSKYLAPEGSVNSTSLRKAAFDKTMISGLAPIKIDRLPNKKYPPFSKDEAISIVSQGFINAKQLEDSHWNFCNLVDYTPEKLTVNNVYKAVKIMYGVQKEAKKNLKKFEETGEQHYLDRHDELTHRNYFWQNRVEETYCLLFWLPWWDQYYVKKFCGESASLLQTIAFYINFIYTLKKGNKSVRMLLWLQCEDIKHWLLRFIPKKKWVTDYFNPDHPFVRSLK